MSAAETSRPCVISLNHPDNFPKYCEAEEPHLLWWLTSDFALCCECNLLYSRQSGNQLVWLYDLWTCRLAWHLAEMHVQRDMALLGVTLDDLRFLREDEPAPAE